MYNNAKGSISCWLNTYDFNCIWNHVFENPAVYLCNVPNIKNLLLQWTFFESDVLNVMLTYYLYLLWGVLNICRSLVELNHYYVLLAYCYPYT